MSKPSAAPVSMWVNLNGGESQPSIRLENSRSHETPDKETKEKNAQTDNPEEEEHVPRSPTFVCTPKRYSKDNRLSHEEWQNTNEFKSLKQQVRDLKEQIVTFEKTREMFMRLQEDYDVLASVKVENAKLLEEIQSLQELADQQQSEQTSTSAKQQQEIERLKKSNHKQQTELEALRDAKESLYGLQKEFDEANSQMEFQCNKISELEGELSCLRTNSKESIRKLQTELTNVQTANEHAQKEVSSQHEKHLKHQIESAKALNAAKESARTLEQENQHISDEFQTAKKHVRDLETRIGNIQRDLDAASRECDILIEAKAILMSDVAELKSVVTTKCEEVQCLMTEKDELSVSNAKLMESLAKMTSDCQAMRRLLEYKKNRERVAGDTPQRQLVKRDTHESERLLQKLNDMRAEVVESRQALWSLEQQNEALRDRCNYVELDRDRIQLLLIQVTDELERQRGKARRKRHSKEQHSSQCSPGCKCSVL